MRIAILRESAPADEPTALSSRTKMSIPPATCAAPRRVLKGEVPHRTVQDTAEGREPASADRIPRHFHSTSIRHIQKVEFRATP